MGKAENYKESIVKAIIKNKIAQKKSNEDRGISSEIVVAPTIENYMGKDEALILSNLTRGLKVTSNELNRAKRSLHRARKIGIKKMLALSYTDTEICMELNIGGISLAKYKKDLFRDEVKALTEASPDELFVMYKFNQMEVVKELDVVIHKYKGIDGNCNALASALKTKADILRDIAEKAIKMGYMDKQQNVGDFVNGVNLHDVSDDDLMEMNIDQLELLKDLKQGKLTSTTEIKRVFKPTLKLVSGRRT